MVRKKKKERNTGLYGQNPQVKKHTKHKRRVRFHSQLENALDTSPGGDGEKKMEKLREEIRRRWRQKRGLVLR